jgi:hypothetical protein
MRAFYLAPLLAMANLALAAPASTQPAGPAPVSRAINQLKKRVSILTMLKFFSL